MWDITNLIAPILDICGTTSFGMDLLTPVDAVSKQEQQGAVAHGRVEPSKPYQVVERQGR